LEVKDFAERLLVGTQLEDKLFSAPLLSDVSPGKDFRYHERPGRPSALAFSDYKEQHLLRKLKTLKTDAERGQLLHFFANHEILAIELMALALLKFPDADPVFRKKICQTIADEQKHARLYFQRMNECGVELGDVPLSPAFWDHLHGMNNLSEYICGLSLTLEQANLDFAHAYAKRFQEAGDERTSQLLWAVYEDECFHVQVGVDMMNELRGKQSQWDFYCENLLEPLSPARAKAAPFLEEPRRKIGLDEGFIQQLKHYQRSKGRPPDVYLFNGLAEKDMIQGGPASKKRLLMERDLQSMMHLFCRQDDVLVLDEACSISFQEHLLSTGRCLPEVHLTHELNSPRHRHVGEIIPWAWSPRLKMPLKPWLPLQTRSQRLRWSQLYHPGVRQLSDKCWQRSLELAFKGHDSFYVPVNVTLTEENFGTEDLMSLLPCSTDRWLIKPPFGVAGHGQISWVSEETFPLSKVKAIIKEQGHVLLEEKLRRRADFSMQGRFIPGISENGNVSNDRIQWLGVSRMLIDGGGAYVGAILGGVWEGLSVDEKRAMHTTAGPVFKEIESILGTSLKSHFASVGFSGSFGIDGFLCERTVGQYSYRPVCELNARMTFGQVALVIEKKIAKNKTGLMVFGHCLNRDEACQKSELERGHWSRGCFAINDVWQSSMAELWCLVGKDMAEVLSLMDQNFETALTQRVRACLDSTCL
jgi:uncharacterized ferritin-like protein (DUF455 family)